MKRTLIALSLAAASLTTLSQQRVSHAAVIYSSEYLEEPPSFPGGERAMLRYINQTRTYPDSMMIEGRVVCSFVVQADGTVNDVTVVRSLDSTLDREAVRVITSMPPWHPGRVDGRPVPVYYTLPIPFRP